MYYSQLTKSEQLLCELAFFFIQNEKINWDDALAPLMEVAFSSDNALVIEGDQYHFEQWHDDLNCMSFDSVEFAAEKLVEAKNELAEEMEEEVLLAFSEV